MAKSKPPDAGILSRVEAHPLIRERPFPAGREPADQALARDVLALGPVDAAEPLLVELLRGHPLLALRQAAGWALLTRRTPAAHRALQESREPALGMRSLVLDPRARALAVASGCDWLSMPVSSIGAAQHPEGEPFAEADPSPWGELAARRTLTADERARVEALAEAIMHRVARNADRVTERLTRLGWPLGPTPRSSPSNVVGALRNPFSGTFLPRPPTVAAQLADLAERTQGPVPLALATFWRVVGGIDWTAAGELPDWAPPAETIDPLAVYPASDASHWLTQWERRGRAEPFFLPFSTDSLHKGLGAGLWPYEIRLPTADVDPVVLNAPEKLRFVPYLRNAFRWGGLPGLAYLEHTAELDAVLAQLTDGLEPI